MSTNTTSQVPATGTSLPTLPLGFWCGLGAFATWVAMGVDSILRPIQDNRRDAFWALPFVLTVITLCCLHVVQRRRSRVESIGFMMVMFSSALMLVGSIGLQMDIKWLLWLGVPGGPIIWTIGMVCFGIGTLIARVLPRYAGWALIAFEPSAVLIAVALSPIAPMLPRGAYSGNVGKGIAIGLVALALRNKEIRAGSASPQTLDAL